jgi:diguanylate cyclase (GGDEF)-like protein
MVSHDRGLIARTFGTICIVAALVSGISLLVPTSGNRSEAVLAATSLFALLLGSLFFVTYRRTPMWAFQAATALGSVAIALATLGGSDGAEGGYAVFFVWVVLLSFLFFDVRAAILQSVFAATAYAVVLIAKDADFAFNYVFGLIAVLGAAGGVVGFMRVRLETLSATLAGEASTDALTGVANRRGFDQRFEIELARVARLGRSLSVIVCDLDRFKEVNDELGHEQGDDVLRRVAERITSSLRSIDAVARIGGEEFAMLLPESTPMEAFVVAERIRKGVMEEFADFPVPLTASCGVATTEAVGVEPRTDGRFRIGDGNAVDGAALLRAADEAMYRAKQAGRNCTVVDGAEVAGAHDALL